MSWSAHHQRVGRRHRARTARRRTSRPARAPDARGCCPTESGSCDRPIARGRRALAPLGGRARERRRYVRRIHGPSASSTRHERGLRRDGGPVFEPVGQPRGYGPSACGDRARNVPSACTFDQHVGRQDVGVVSRASGVRAIGGHAGAFESSAATCDRVRGTFRLISPAARAAARASSARRTRRGKPRRDRRSSSGPRGRRRTSDRRATRGTRSRSRRSCRCPTPESRCRPRALAPPH